MTYDLNNPEDRRKLALEIKSDINDFSVSHFSEAIPRKHLGASIIGKKCKRFLWLTFRWAAPPAFDGRMYRLFNRGHLEEPRFVLQLRGIGFTVHETDPATNQQFRISGCGGHFGGSLDAILFPPNRYGIAEPVLGEFKTHGQKSYDKYLKDGVALSKPEHVEQMHTYGPTYNLNFGFYFPVNKNDDSIDPEIIKLDPVKANANLLKADSVIRSQTPPPKIALDPAFFDCKYCDQFRDICHFNKPPVKNCRSCVRASPVQGGQWFCEMAKDIIPEDFIPVGCGSWTRIV